MGGLEILLVAVGLSMDAFAVAVCKGACLRDDERGESLVIALSLGGFQALMPLLGWLLGSSVSAYVQSFDHLIAFALLAFVGIKLIREACRKGEASPTCTPLRFSELMMLSLATSIDALAAGIAFAVLDLNIWKTVVIIGAVTFSLSFLAVRIGRRFGTRYQARAQLAGGAALIMIGVKVMVEHLAA